MVRLHCDGESFKLILQLGSYQILITESLCQDLPSLSNSVDTSQHLPGIFRQSISQPVNLSFLRKICRDNYGEPFSMELRKVHFLSREPWRIHFL